MSRGPLRVRGVGIMKIRYVCHLRNDNSRQRVTRKIPGLGVVCHSEIAPDFIWAGGDDQEWTLADIELGVMFHED